MRDSPVDGAGGHRCAARREFFSRLEVGMVLLLLPAILSFLLLAAHFLRSGNYLAVLGLLALIPLLALRRPWVALVARATLWLGAGVWLYTGALFTVQRLRLGEPYLRMVLILGGVALFTALSSLVFSSTRLRRRYGGGSEVSVPAPAAPVEEPLPERV